MTTQEQIGQLRSHGAQYPEPRAVELSISLMKDAADTISRLSKQLETRIDEAFNQSARIVVLEGKLEEAREALKLIRMAAPLESGAGVRNIASEALEALSK